MTMPSPPTDKAWFEWAKAVAVVIQLLVLPAIAWAVHAELRLQNHEDTHQTIEKARVEHNAIEAGVRQNERTLDGMQPDLTNLDEKLDDGFERFGVQLQRMERKIDNGNGGH